MTVRKIKKEEREHVLALSSLNKRKDYLQDINVTELAREKKVIFQLGTSYGKTWLSIKAITRCLNKFGGSAIVVVPDLRLKASWEKDLKGIDNCYVYVVNSFTMQNKAIPDDVIIAIYDECHHYANPDSMFFSQAIKRGNIKYQACLSATLNDKQLKYLYTLGFRYKWDISLEECLKLNLVIPYQIYNIPVQFTEEEKREYVKIQDEYNNHLHYFEQYLAVSNVNTNLASVLATSLLPKHNSKSTEVKFMGVVYKSPLQLASTIAAVVNVKEGVLMYHAKKWQGYRTKRNNLLHNASNKLVLANQLLNLVKDEKAVVFTNTKINAEKIVKLDKKNRRGYYSGNDHHSILQSFFDFEFPHLIAIKKVDEGQLDNEVRIGISLNHESENRRKVQQLGKKFACTYLNEES